MHALAVWDDVAAHAAIRISRARVLERQGLAAKAQQVLPRHARGAGRYRRSRSRPRAHRAHTGRCPAALAAFASRLQTPALREVFLRTASRVAMLGANLPERAVELLSDAQRPPAIRAHAEAAAANNSRDEHLSSLIALAGAHWRYGTRARIGGHRRSASPARGYGRRGKRTPRRRSGG